VAIQHNAWHPCAHSKCAYPPAHPTYPAPSKFEPLHGTETIARDVLQRSTLSLFRYALLRPLSHCICCLRTSVPRHLSFAIIVLIHLTNCEQQSPAEQQCREKYHRARAGNSVSKSSQSCPRLIKSQARPKPTPTKPDLCRRTVGYMVLYVQSYALSC